jgi:hypothetical protein
VLGNDTAQLGGNMAQIWLCEGPLSWHGTAFTFILGVALSTPMPTPSLGQAANEDTLFRANYCLGVLKSMQEQMVSEQPSKLMSCNTQWASLGWKSAEECKTGVEAAYQAATQEAAKHVGRYTDYLALTMTSQLGNDKFNQLMIIIARGERDAREVHSGQRPLPPACEGRCPDFSTDPNTMESCEIPCIEQFDQVQANVLRCVAAPDHLPF